MLHLGHSHSIGLFVQQNALKTLYVQLATLKARAIYLYQLLWCHLWRFPQLECPEHGQLFSNQHRRRDLLRLYSLLIQCELLQSLSEMKTLGIDLKPLFASTTLFHKIDHRNPNFNEFDRNLKYCIIHSNANSLYDVLYGDKLEFHKKEENQQA